MSYGSWTGNRGLGGTFLVCYQVLSLSFGTHNACLSHFPFYSRFVAIFLGEGLWCRESVLFALLIFWLGEGSWVQTYYHICSSFILTQMITAVYMNMQHPLHIPICTIFVQISLSSKWGWAGVFLFETFPPKSSNLLK